MAAHYYNEFDKKAAAWLRELMLEGCIPAGVVDERSILDVKPHELIGYTQAHFFAGIGGWPLALRLAAWPADRPVWTGSCPCQPFSSAGRQMGRADPRHLWPAFRRLINQCRPPRVFGEQVASKDGRAWLAGVLSDLEIMGYGAAAADLCAAGVGAPHVRQRLYWMADAERGRRQDAMQLARNGGETIAERQTGQPRSSSLLVSMAHAGSEEFGRLSDVQRTEVSASGSCGETERVGHDDLPGSCGRGLRFVAKSGEVDPWSSGSSLVRCTDGRTRRFESGVFPLAHGVSSRVGLLRGYGNAINPWVASEFIQASEEIPAVAHLI